MSAYVKDRLVLHTPAHRRPSLRSRPGAAMLLVIVLTGCGVPPELRESPQTAAPSSAAPSATSAATPSPPPVSAAPPDLPGTDADETTATRCTDGPEDDRIVSVVRSAGILPNGVTVRVRTAPLCAGEWQYSVLEVAGQELQVVTRGRPASPDLVTAGTDVCSIEVRTGAPAGIRMLACDAGPLSGPVV